MGDVQNSLNIGVVLGVYASHIALDLRVKVFVFCFQMIDLAKQGDEETINSWITVSKFLKFPMASISTMIALAA